VPPTLPSGYFGELDDNESGAIAGRTSLREDTNGTELILREGGCIISENEDLVLSHFIVMSCTFTRISGERWLRT